MNASATSSTLVQLFEKREKAHEAKRLPKPTIKTLNHYPSEKIIDGIRQINYSVSIDDAQHGNHYTTVGTMAYHYTTIGTTSVSTFIKPQATKDRLLQGTFASPKPAKDK